MISLIHVPKLTQTCAAALGFSLSAGWDWLPPMHIDWIGSFLSSCSSDSQEYPLFILWFTLSRIVMLAIAGMLMERLFLLFQIRRSGPLRNPGQIRRRPFSRPPLFSPQLDERFHLAMPAFLMQLCGILAFLGILSFDSTNTASEYKPVFVGALSAVLGLLWFYMLVLLPGLYSCVAYAFILLFSLGIAELYSVLPSVWIPFARLSALIVCIPLLFFALPPSTAIKERLVLYRKQQLFERNTLRPFLFRRPLRKISLFFKGQTRRGQLGIGLLVFTMLISMIALLEFAFGSFVHIMGTLPVQAIPPRRLVFSGLLAGVVLTGWLVRQNKDAFLFPPTLGLLLVGAGALLTSLSGGKALSLFILYTGVGCASSCALLLMHHMLITNVRVYPLLATGLILFSSFAFSIGEFFWRISNHPQIINTNYPTTFLQLLALFSLICVLWIYLVRTPLYLLCTTPVLLHWMPQQQRQAPALAEQNQLSQETFFSPQDKQCPLTQREKEVVLLVQRGMKNLEISSALSISEATLRVHLRRIYRKLNIQGRSNLKDLPPF